MLIVTWKSLSSTQYSSDVEASVGDQKIIFWQTGEAKSPHAIFLLAKPREL
jgi:hypothetical protein